MIYVILGLLFGSAVVLGSIVGPFILGWEAKYCLLALGLGQVMGLLLIIILANQIVKKE